MPRPNPIRIATGLMALGLTILPLGHGIALSAPAEERGPQASDLIGEWDVSLFFSPTSPPSATKMVIRAVEDGVVSGTFYQTEFDVGRVTVKGEEVVFSVLTKDGSGLYATSGRLREDGLVYGQTLSVGRAFIMAWEAKRADTRED